MWGEGNTVNELYQSSQARNLRSKYIISPSLLASDISTIVINNRMLPFSKLFGFCELFRQHRLIDFNSFDITIKYKKLTDFVYCTRSALNNLD